PDLGDVPGTVPGLERQGRRPAPDSSDRPGYSAHRHARYADFRRMARGQRHRRAGAVRTPGGTHGSHRSQGAHSNGGGARQALRPRGPTSAVGRSARVARPFGKPARGSVARGSLARGRRREPPGDAVLGATQLAAPHAAAPRRNLPGSRGRRPDPPTPTRAARLRLTMTTKPTLSYWQIWNMSFGFLGIQFGFALQNANVSRIFETLGAKVENIPILWIAAPVTGLLVQPIVGYLSDRTWNRLGRRRPYFLTGAILASLALLVMPNSPARWGAAGMLWIMDASINISMEPFRAFVGDNLPAAQRVTGFAMQSFFIGTGAVVASALPWILTNLFGVKNEAAVGHIPESVRLSFYLGAAV